MPFYEKLEQKFKMKFDDKFLIKKVFKSIEDQNNWFSALDNSKLTPFLDEKLDKNNYSGVISEFNFGNVKEAGRVDTKKLVETYRNYLRQKSNIKFEQFEHQKVKFNEDELKYKGITANRIVFCEGFGMKQNLFFNYLPLNEVKGELITIYAPDLDINFLLKSSLFVLPLGNHHYKVGATFNWKDKTSNPSEEGKEELVEKLKKVINVKYKIIEQTAGVRPTVKDRRPLVGKHPAYPNLIILNGLGTRGVMIAPIIAKQLFYHLENGTELDAVSDIKRFE